MPEEQKTSRQQLFLVQHHMDRYTGSRLSFASSHTLHSTMDHLHMLFENATYPAKATKGPFAFRSKPTHRDTLPWKVGFIRRMEKSWPWKQGGANGHPNMLPCFPRLPSF